METKIMERADLIKRLKDLLNISDDEQPKLAWATLCKYTNFDSFATAFAFGFNWQDDNMETMPEANLRMAIFNITAFPKANKLTNGE